jgi:hypothetical protein
MGASVLRSVGQHQWASPAAPPSNSQPMSADNALSDATNRALETRGGR